MNESNAVVGGVIQPPAAPGVIRAFQWRALISVIVLISFAFLLVSGIGLWFAPPGRVANWTDWTIFGLRKHEWADLHIWFAVVFLVASTFHVVLNWRPFVGYFRSRLTRHFSVRREWLAALILCGVVFAGTRMEVAPFSSLLAFTEKVRGRWDIESRRPPVPHAELLTLNELATEAGLDLSNALARLEARKIAGVDPKARLAELAERNGLSAQQVYQTMFGGVKTLTGAPQSGMRGRPGGSGQLTLAEFCEAEAIDLSVAVARLQQKGLDPSANQTLREIAVKGGLDRPYDVLQIVRGNH